MKKTFGSNLKEIRELNGLSQNQLAKLLNTSQQRVSEWENNKSEPYLYNIIKIMRVFNISFDELIEDIEI